ncbi:hypothetical protein PMI15_02081 [Polaromonas sp. CF318]|uniref:hypothetical protein n=1 Tax=Polaromonas sp. CF318 TaxID=1144318 RepID=UPI00027117A0|nr:hypothetical protein [Polaromonas sp. CF318]EJL84602.1 hypothetical protein PMI15_02081 [Polaromonas sp. CF318]
MAHNNYLSGEMMYEYVSHVLANYFSINSELSEEEAIADLRKHFFVNAILKKEIYSDLRQALNDDSFSWKDALQRYDVFHFENENEARSYVVKTIWEPLFGE